MNCSALGSLAIEKGFETTVDKLLKELLKKAAGAVGGVLGGAAAISGGIVIGMLLSTEEVGESKEELDELEREQEKKKEQENGSGINKKGQDEFEDAEQARKEGEPRDNHEVVEKGKSLPAKGKPNSSADLLNPDGSVKQRRYYGPDGKAQQDIDFNHSDDGTHEFPHTHEWDWSKNPPRQKP